MTISTEIPTAQPVDTDVPAAPAPVKLTDMDRALIAALCELCFGWPQEAPTAMPVAEPMTPAPRPAKSRTERKRKATMQPLAT